MKKTKKYDMFILRQDNREKIIQSHVENLVRSISSRNLLEFKPILVNANMEIIDGQHRFLAAKRLGVEVYYTVEPELEVRDVILMNTAKAWGMSDYLHYYCTNEHEEYLKLKDFMETNNLSLTIAMSLTSSQSKFDAFDFKHGEYKFHFNNSADTLNVCNETIKCIKRVNGTSVSVYTSTGRFWRGFLTIAKHPDFDAEKWLFNLERMASRLGPKATLAEYKKAFLGIYNWRNAKKIRLNEEETPED